MKKLRFFVIAVLVASALAGYALRSGSAVDESVYLDEVAPGVSFGDKGGGPPHYEPLDNKSVVAFNTYDVTPSIRGYAGPIKMLLAIDSTGRISGIRILEHRETPNYVHVMETPAYLEQFLGKHVSDPFEPDKDIDGISRATVSVKALADTVKESSREVAKGVFGIRIAEEASASGPFRFLKAAAFVLLFSLSLGAYFFTRYPGRARKLKLLRDASLVLGIAVIGLWLSAPFSVLNVFNLMMLRPSSDLLWFAVLLAVGLSVALAGRFYCGWLCPFGAVSEFIGRLPAGKWGIGVQTDDSWRRVKYFLLAAVGAVVLISGRTGYGAFETYLTLFSFSGSAPAWALLIICIAASLRVRRFWCRFLCPVAALTGLMSREDPSYPSAADCPMANRPGPLASECIRCNRCYAPKASGIEDRSGKNDET